MFRSARLRSGARQLRDAAPAEKRQVLFLSTPLLPPLGADTWVQLQVLGALDRDTHDVHVACARGPRQDPSLTYQAVSALPDVSLVELNLGPELSSASTSARKAKALVATLPALPGLARLAWYIRRHHIEIIHTTDRPRDAAAGVFLARITGARCVIHVHVAWGDWMSGLLQRSLRRADALVAVSSFVAGTLDASGHDPNKTYVALNGIDPASWTPGVGRDGARRELGISDDAPLLITVCRLYGAKGTAELVQALAKVRADVPNVRLAVVGAELVPGYRRTLETLVESLGLADAVTFLGRRDDVARLMAAADVYAMPSIDEPFGLVFCEAMAMQLPVVALASGGALEIIEHGDTGLLSERGDIDALADNLRQLIADDHRRASMGARGRQVVEARFTTRRMAQDVARIYGDVLAGVAPDRGRTAMTGQRTLAATDVQAITAELEEKGFVVLPGVVRREPLAQLARELEEVYAASPKFEGGGMITGHLNCFPGRLTRFVYDELAAAGVIDVIHTIRNGKPSGMRVTANYNLPGSVAQHRHMDGLFTEDFLICNVAVVDTDVVNGAIDMLPGTNREFMPFWKYALRRRYKLSKRIEAKAGDVLIRKSTAWHRGMPNLSTKPRPMVALTFGEQSAPVGDQLEQFEQDPYFYANWYSTGKKGALREKVYVAAPVSYSAFRFVKSLTGTRGYDKY